MLNWTNKCILELRDKAERFAQTGLIHVLDAELTVVKSDTAVSEELDARLREGVKALEDVPEAAKDWHPRSNKQVLDLLHPSLFPVVHGRTKQLDVLDGRVPRDRCTEFIGKGNVGTGPSSVDATGFSSFQWLPTDVELTDAGAKIIGYINNLLPAAHAPLYRVLERFVDASVPLWEEALSWFVDRRRLVLESTADEDDFVLPEGLTYPRSEGSGDEQEADEDESDESWRYSDRYLDWRDQHRILQFREPDEFKPFARSVRLSDRVDLRSRVVGRGYVQVIFKLANIYLTPEQPEYEGGSWHVEGSLDERICATAIYYYDQENVTPSHLAFRQGLDAEELMMIPAQSEYTSLEKYLGVEQDGAAIQHLGSVLTRPRRLLAFPNALQHQVQPFGLEDKSKPGHRKILAMFLIDPAKPIPSTSDVPPQRKDWWMPEVRKVPAFAQLPYEIFEQIIDMVDDFPISWSDALDIRESLMDERTDLNADLDDEMREVGAHSRTPGRHNMLMVHRTLSPFASIENVCEGYRTG